MTERATLVPRLDILRKGELVRSVPMNRPSLVLGSEEGADLRLKHPAIANRHLEISVVQGRYLEAMNLAGEGRVLLGGHPVSRVRLRENDELDLGPVSIRLSFNRSGRLRKVTTQDELKVPTSDSSMPAVPGPSQEEEPTDPGSAAPFVPDPFAPVPTPPPPRTPRPTSAAVVAVPSPPAVRPGNVGLPPRHRQEAPPPPPRPSSQPAKPRPTAPPSADDGVDVDLDDLVLDPAPVVVLGPTSGRPQQVPLRVGSFVIGAGRCAFRLTYPGVAPAHAEVMVMPDGVVYLKHLAGAGLVTLRNGAPIQFSRWSAGDSVQVGPVVLKLLFIPQAELARSGPMVDTSGPAVLVPPAPTGAPLPSLAPQAVAPPAPIAPPAIPPAAANPVLPPAVASRPVVRVRGRKSTPEDVRPNEVVVQLNVRAQDTFASMALAEDLPPPPRSPWMVMVFIALLALVGIQGWALYQKGRTEKPVGPQVAPVTANAAAASGPQRAKVQGGNGAVRIGDHKAVRGGGGGASPRPATRVDEDGIDWGDTEFREARDDGNRIRGSEAFAAVGTKQEPAEGPGTTSTAQGWVDMPIVEKAIYDQNKLLRSCFEDARHEQEGLAGKLWMTLTLEPDGHIRGAVAEPRSSLRHGALEACLARRLSTITFPKPEGGSVTFSYPFEFQ